MDWLDKLSIATIVVLASVTVTMIAQSEMANRKQGNLNEDPTGEAAFEEKKERNQRIYQDLLGEMEKGDLAQAKEALEAIMTKYPENAQSYVYMAQIHLEEGKLGESIQKYRHAVETDPDLVDERTPFFIGDKLENIVKEGTEKFKREKELKPGDETVDKVLKDVYYLQRRLAGGCE